MSISARLTEIRNEADLQRARALLAGEAAACRHIIGDATRAPDKAAMQVHIDNLGTIVEMLEAVQDKLPA